MNLKLSFFLIIILIFNNCSNISNQKSQKENLNSINYAKGFTLQDYSSFRKLTILTSFKGDTSAHDYYLIPKSQQIPDSLTNKSIIRTPISSVVVTSTTHIPMLELLGVENTLVGFPNTNYVSSKKTRALIDSGIVKELGQVQNINTEILLDLQPEIIIGFGVNNTSKVFQNIQKMGIPVIMNSDWLEQTPLGRAEWIRFFGVLYNKDSIAKVHFKKIAKSYNLTKQKLSQISTKPTVISGSLFQDVWHTPAGESYVAHFFNDAKVNYLWKDTKGTGSLPLSLESVLDKGKNADFWIAPGFYTTKKEMLQDSPHYKEFNAFTKDNVFTYAINKGSTGGVLYFELATTRPDLVLKDLVKIFHPNTLPDYQMTLFSKMK